MDWDIPYYSLFISAMEKMPKQVTIFPIEEHVIEVESIAPNEYWFRAGEKEKISSLNKQYFHLTDTAGAYVELK
jgi:F0F1-type ATP synthase gamma subunit